MILFKHKSNTVSTKYTECFSQAKGSVSTAEKKQLCDITSQKRLMRGQRKTTSETTPQLVSYKSSQETGLTCAVSSMAFSNSRYASHKAVPFVTCSPTAVNALSNIERTFSIPPSWPMPPIEYWAYSNQISGPKQSYGKQMT